ncbi:hypothetical protein [Argonema antarcticum]|uniref:hypothetical protein n=1 Tax=Argonema antarcticum TaxID=2942763 RepID=UPI0020139568|nr:hypothetical protein [Argonema antarcticum]MCL1475178.1 hypothetical protein [Argonema antarcticum A004/B2]
MSNATQLPNQQYQRMIELCEIARQRYLDAGGDPKRSSGTLHGNEHLTEEERKEFFALGRQLSGFKVKDGYAYHLGESWKLLDDLPSQKKEVKSEVK